MVEKRHILVVDDEALVREFSERALRAGGYEVTACEDGARAIELVRQRGASLRATVLDLSMPGMSGDETFHALRELHPELPVLITSGFDDADASPLLAGNARTAFLRKPYGAHALLGAVRELLGTD